MKIKTIVERNGNSIKKFDYAGNNKLSFIDVNNILGLFKENSTINSVVAFGIKVKINSLIEMAVNKNKPIEYYFNTLMNATDKQDYIDVFNEIFIVKSSYSIVKKIELKEQLHSHSDVVLSYTALCVAAQYYKQKFSNFADHKIETLENCKLQGMSLEELLSMADADILQNTKFADLAKEVFYNYIDDKFFEIKNDCTQDHHLCMSCENATVGRCQKIADRRKLAIEHYDFITKGYQICDEYGKVDKFVINECNNYSKDKPRRYTKEQLELYEEYKQSLLLAYYDANDITELSIKQLYDIGLSIKELDQENMIRKRTK